MRRAAPRADPRPDPALLPRAPDRRRGRLGGPLGDRTGPSRRPGRHRSATRAARGRPRAVRRSHASGAVVTATAFANDASRNAADLAELERVIGRVGPEFARQAFIGSQLMAAGYTVRPPAFVGARMQIALPDGRPISLTRILRLSRLQHVRDATCCGCRRAMLVRRPWRTVGSGSRGSRADIRYCSNACRQRAYRARTRPSSLIADTADGRPLLIPAQGCAKPIGPPDVGRAELASPRSRGSQCATGDASRSLRRPSAVSTPSTIAGRATAARVARATAAGPSATSPRASGSAVPRARAHDTAARSW